MRYPHYIENLGIHNMNLDPDCYTEQPRRRVVRSIAGGLWAVLRHLIYMVLMLVRLPLQLLSHVLFFPLVGFGIFWGLSAGWNSPACLWMVGTGVGIYVVSYLFDSLLLWVSPETLYLET